MASTGTVAVQRSPTQGKRKDLRLAALQWRLDRLFEQTLGKSGRAVCTLCRMLTSQVQSAGLAERVQLGGS